MNENGYFGIVRWCDEDIAGLLTEMCIEPRQEYIDEIRCRCENGHFFADAMIEAGWGVMQWVAWEAIEEGNIRFKDGSTLRTSARQEGNE